MTDTLVGGWWEGSADRNLAISTWNRLDHSLARPFERQLFDTDDVLIEPLRTLRKVAMALALGDTAPVRVLTGVRRTGSFQCYYFAFSRM